MKLGFYIGHVLVSGHPNRPSMMQELKTRIHFYDALILLLSAIYIAIFSNTALLDGCSALKLGVYRTSNSVWTLKGAKHDVRT